MSLNQHHLKNAVKKINNIQSKAAKDEPIDTIEEKIVLKLKTLEEINSKILTTLKDPKRYSQNNSFGQLLDKRLVLSSEIEQLCNSSMLSDLDLSDETKVIFAKVLSQDKELMIYLEMEVQKLQGKYKRLQLQSQKIDK